MMMAKDMTINEYANAIAMEIGAESRPVEKEKLDKDRFRRDLGNVEGAYREMQKRIFGA